MKKNLFIYIIAALATVAVSCQKEDYQVVEDDNDVTAGVLTASFVQTKVTYTETPEINLQPAWEVGDKIIGFDDAGNTYTLTVKSVSANTAILEGSVPDGNLHLIYKSGAQASDITSKSLDVDYKGQAGDKTIPAVMLADGTVENGGGHFTFINAGSIIGISAMNNIPSGSTIRKVTIEGENLSAATVSLDGSTLTLTAKTAANESISTADLSGITVTDADGTLSSSIFIAVPAGAIITAIKVDSFDSYTYRPTPTTVQPGEYLYIKGQVFSLPYCSYTVRYVDKDTNQQIAEPVCREVRTGVEVTEQAIDIVGYSVVGGYAQITAIINGGEELIFYYERLRGTYTVKYLELGTDRPLAHDKVVTDVPVGSNVTEQAIDIDGYFVVYYDQITATINGGEELIFYYERSRCSYTVRYMDIDTFHPLAPDKVVTDVPVGTTVIEQAIDIRGYYVIGDDQITAVINGGDVLFFIYKEATINL